jgi:hypothetical protein
MPIIVYGILMPSDKSERRSTAGATAAARQAQEMLDAFASVGAERFDLTITDIAGVKVGFRGSRPFDALRLALPDLLRQAADRQHNIIVRPRFDGTALIQLDDLNQSAAERLRPVSFLVLNTSVGNYQAWIAVADADADFARLLRKGTGADLTASGATRIGGSFNFKNKYAAAGFPRIQTVHSCPGLIVSRSDLEALGIVAPPEKVSSPPARVTRSSEGKAWPSYQRCVQNAPPARDGDRPDISRADFTFCLLAIDWGRHIEETAARLMKESSKAKENGEAYALHTAQNAAAALARRGVPQR